MEPVEFIEKNYTLIGENPDGNPLKIKGMDREGMYQLFAKLGYKTGCEVGLEKGKNVQTMFEVIPNLKLYGVDPYRQYPQYSSKASIHFRHWDDDFLQGVKKQAQNRMEGKNAIIIEKFSEDAVKDIPDNSLDFVYIDGDHSYDCVMQDIILWGRKVRKGGIVSGHDYFYNNDRSGRNAKVTQAVNDYAKVHGIKFYITNEKHHGKKGDNYPSWFWVKLDDIYPNVIGA